MTVRFKVLSALYLVMLLLGANTEGSQFQGVLGVMVGLGALLILSVIALWPNSSRTERVERNLEGATWADRIDIASASEALRRAEP